MLVPFVLGCAVAFGAVIELAQGVTPHRYFDWVDLLANVLGASLASVWLLAERRIRYVDVGALVADVRER